MTTESAAVIWRDDVIDGVPASGVHEPDKAQIRAYHLEKEAVLNATGYRRSVAQFLVGAASDRAAFEAAIASVPLGKRAVITVEDIKRPILLTGGYLDPGNRRISWDVDPNAVFNGGSDVEWNRLNGPIVSDRGIYLSGYANRSDNTGFTIRVGGGGAISAREPGISGFADVQEQAYQHERGRAALFMSVSDAGQVGVDNAGIASHTQISLPAGIVSVNQLRVGMFVDAPGTTFPTIPNQPWRYTTRISGWTTSGGFATALQIEGWYRSSSNGKSAVNEFPSVNRGTPTGRILINPLNKVWGSNLNIYLTRENAQTYEKTSGCFGEWAIFNNSGDAFEDDFHQNTHPRHFYGLDLNSIGDYGGGTAFLVRGTQRWGRAFRVKSAVYGFEYEGTEQTNGGVGFVTLATPQGAPTSAFRSELLVGGERRRMVAISGATPDVSIGRTDAASEPTINFNSAGAGAAFDVRIYATGGTASNGGGTLRVNANVIRFDKAFPSSATGLQSGALWRDANGFLKVV